MTGRPSWLTCCSGRRNNPKLVCHMARRVGHSRTAGRWKYECLAIGNSIEVMKSADAVRWQALRVLTNSPHGRTAKGPPNRHRVAPRGGCQFSEHILFGGPPEQ